MLKCVNTKCNFCCKVWANGCGYLSDEINLWVKETDSSLASDQQIGGDHYKKWKIQPFEFFQKNNIPFHKADIIKRILRYDLPTGKGQEDLDKIKHEIDLIMEFE